MNIFKFCIIVLSLLAFGLAAAKEYVPDLDDECQPSTIAKLSFKVRGTSYERTWWVERMRDIDRQETRDNAFHRSEFVQNARRDEAIQDRYDREVAAAERRRADASGDTARMREFERSLSPNDRRAIEKLNRALAATSFWDGSIASDRAWIRKCRAYAEDQLRRLK